SSPTAQRIRSRQAHRVCREVRDAAARRCGSLAQHAAWPAAITQPVAKRAMISMLLHKLCELIPYHHRVTTHVEAKRTWPTRRAQGDPPNDDRCLSHPLAIEDGCPR